MTIVVIVLVTVLGFVFLVVWARLTRPEVVRVPRHVPRTSDGATRFDLIMYGSLYPERTENGQLATVVA